MNKEVARPHLHFLGIVLLFAGLSYVVLSLFMNFDTVFTMLSKSLLPKISDQLPLVISSILVFMFHFTFNIAGLIFLFVWPSSWLFKISKKSKLNTPTKSQTLVILGTFYAVTLVFYGVSEVMGYTHSELAMFLFSIVLSSAPIALILAFGIIISGDKK